LRFGDLSNEVRAMITAVNPSPATALWARRGAAAGGGV
jgi:hypothetical protein